MHRLIVTLAAALLTGPFVLAQESQVAALPDAPSARAQGQQPAPQSPDPDQSGGFIALLQKTSLVFPDIATRQGPLTSGQKFKLAANKSISLSAIGASLVGAGFSQALDTPSGYHQGGEGYAKRFGASMARIASDNLFSTFLLASAFHQDPRFFVIQDLSFKQSIKYAAVRVFVTRSDSGQRVANYSGLIGPLLAEGLANAYYPDENRSAGETLGRYGVDIGVRFAGNLAREYFPTLNRKIHLVPIKSAKQNP